MSPGVVALPLSELLLHWGWSRIGGHEQRPRDIVFFLILDL